MTSRIGSRPKQKSSVKREAIHAEPQSWSESVASATWANTRSRPPDGYAPGEFAAGDAVRVRFDADKMFVRRNGGGELETMIIKRIG